MTEIHNSFFFFTANRKWKEIHCFNTHLEQQKHIHSLDHCFETRVPSNPGVPYWFNRGAQSMGASFPRIGGGPLTWWDDSDLKRGALMWRGASDVFNFIKAVVRTIPGSGFPLISNKYVCFTFDWSALGFCKVLNGAVTKIVWETLI